MSFLPSPGAGVVLAVSCLLILVLRTGVPADGLIFLLLFVCLGSKVGSTRDCSLVQHPNNDILFWRPDRKLRQVEMDSPFKASRRYAGRAFVHSSPLDIEQSDI
ncbi:hypothetical protein NEOLEDRAFT_464799 [Neolentinus lepideus HHB14362 ss-1]|uniref:Uncharacterized protein n=1 Tax=Neolentinus lepideus HHB14362 ss-1 TaxID=1314782 RepID=A0A165VHX9_9AGAM|nr:hypothetical protein NEOLEDRAFT_464799 [Neolentinus lepideus HHB14362 ss-1]